MSTTIRARVVHVSQLPLGEIDELLLDAEALLARLDAADRPLVERLAVSDTIRAYRAERNRRA